MRRTVVALAVLGAMAVAAPAGAVVGGQPVSPETVPWFASISGCGGVLVAPDRVVTAGHCVAHRSMKELEFVDVSGVVRKTARVAMHHGWRHENGHNLLDDVAIIQLESPADGVTPAALGATHVPQATILGRGRSTVPGSGASEEQTFDLALRDAPLRLISDASCASAFRHHKGNGGERFDPARMLCAVDVDGRAPLSSGCNGDSGGPLYTGAAAAPVLLGVVSWGGSRCGADHLPSVFADVARYRNFILNPLPTWGPLTAQPAKVIGNRAVGARLTCSTSGFTGRPTKLAYEWQRQGGRNVRVVSRARTYTVLKADAGHPLVCAVEASNAGGVFSVPFATSAIAKIPR
jgi:secreted trypsin-like serine protease